MPVVIYDKNSTSCIPCEFLDLFQTIRRSISSFPFTLYSELLLDLYIDLSLVFWSLAPELMTPERRRLVSYGEVMTIKPMSSLA